MTEPVVFLPGLMCDASVFGPQIAALSRDRAVMCAPVAGADRIETLARDVLKAVPENFALVGQGLGGAVAMEVVRQAPRRVNRIALLNTSCLQETPERAAEREPLIVSAKAGRLDDVMRGSLEPGALAPGPLRVEVMNTVLRMAHGLGAEVFERQSRAMQRRPDQQTTLRKLDMPALVACGRHDAIFPVARHEVMASLIAGASFEVFEDAGHLPTLEASGGVTAALNRWLTDTLLLT